MNELIGRVIATEKAPTTMDKFSFWTDKETKLNAFDVIKVEHIDESVTFGVVENISHITDAQSFLTNFISSDFGDPEATEQTLRIGMNYVEAKVSYNNKGCYTPVLNGAKVYLATAEEITAALGLKNIKNPLVCGSLMMYEGTGKEVTLLVNLNSQFLLGPEGAHLNISGISGLAAKTSYSMFLMKAIQDQYIENNDNDDGVAFVIFNVKGKDLMAIDKENTFEDNPEYRDQTIKQYETLGLKAAPFKNVKYYIPYSDSKSAKASTYLSKEDVKNYMEAKRLKKFKFIYEDDKENIEMMFANIDDTTQTMDAILNKIMEDPEFSGIGTWEELVELITKKTQKGSSTDKNEISVLSWRKFKRVIAKTLKDDMFANMAIEKLNECRLGDELRKIRKNEVHVIDIAKLPEDKQAFVFGTSIRTIYNLKLGEYDDSTDVKPPAKIVIFIDELNKYASKEVPKSSPILREILDVTERGRSLGVVLFGAEQFRSAIHNRVTGNCATHAYGRTNSIEISTSDYGSLPATFKNMLTRLSQGEYLIQNPVFRSLIKIKFPMPIYKQFKS